MRINIYHSDSLRDSISGEKNVALSEFNLLRSNGVSSNFFDYSIPKFQSFHLNQVAALANSVWSPTSPSFVTRSIKVYKPDLLHFHGIFPYYSISALYRAHMSGLPVVQTLHNSRWLCLEGSFYRNYSPCFKCLHNRSSFSGIKHACYKARLPSLVASISQNIAFFNNNLFKWVDKFIAVSDFIKDTHVKYGFPESKIVVKPNFVSPTQHVIRRQLPHSPTIVFVGRLVKAKGTELLKSVFSSFSCQIIIIGEGPELDPLLEFCKESNFEHVKFLGKLPHNETLSVLANASLVVIPSVCSESFSLVAAEAMSLGLPIVASDVGGLSTLVRNSRAGFVFPVDRPDIMIDSISLVLKSSSLASSFSTSGLIYSKESLGSAKNFNFLMSIYKSLLSS